MKRNRFQTEEGNLHDVIHLDREEYRLVYADVDHLLNVQVQVENIQGKKKSLFLTWEQIYCLPVNEITAEDSFLVLSCPVELLPQTLELAGIWRFSLLQVVPWFYVPNPEERIDQAQVKESRLILVCRRGISYPLQPLAFLSSDLPWEDQENVYYFCEKLPGPHLELVSTRSSPEWDSWGGPFQTIDILERLPQEFLFDTMIASAGGKIRTLWDQAENVKWSIGDVMIGMVKGGIKPTAAWKIAASQMNGIETMFWPRLMYKVAQTFPKGSRDTHKPWHSYRKEYLEIAKKQTENRRHLTKLKHGTLLEEIPYVRRLRRLDESRQPKAAQRRPKKT